MKPIFLFLIFFFFSLSCNITTVDIPISDDSEEKIVQSIDADTLNFYSETQLRNFLRRNLLADYTVIPPTFVPYQDYLSVVPGNFYYNVIDPETGVAVSSNQHYLYEELFAGKYYVSFKDHNHTWKLNNQMIPVYCPEGDMKNVTEWITNPYTGQVVAFHDVYNWSDRNGQNIYNLNLKLWLLWDFAPGVVSFHIDAIHEGTGCDYTFVEFFPGHESMELNFHFMEETYGYLR